MERVAEYRRLANEARDLAQQASDRKAAEAFSRISDHWELLAREVEALVEWQRTMNVPPPVAEAIKGWVRPRNQG